MDSEKRLEQLEQILAGLVRCGFVTDVDNDKHMARVKYEGEGITSGWLYVLNNRRLEINDSVLVLYLPVFNADGFVLGGVG